MLEKDNRHGKTTYQQLVCILYPKVNQKARRNRIIVQARYVIFEYFKDYLRNMKGTQLGESAVCDWQGQTNDRHSK